jgi:hypothetical protein
MNSNFKVGYVLVMALLRPAFFLGVAGAYRVSTAPTFVGVSRSSESEQTAQPRKAKQHTRS